jgi:uncharacterized Zn-binding protein involved in type VI secretion
MLGNTNIVMNAKMNKVSFGGSPAAVVLDRSLCNDEPLKLIDKLPVFMVKGKMVRLWIKPVSVSWVIAKPYPSTDSV